MKFRVAKSNVIPYARNIDEEVEIATPAEYEKYLAEGAIEPLEELPKQKKVRKVAEKKLGKKSKK